jgi:hypothetical protein
MHTVDEHLPDTPDRPCGPALPPGAAEVAEARLRGNPYLALRNVVCTYRHGVLTLYGCLPTYYLKQVALAAVAQVAGVERVANEIEVVTPPGRVR